MAKIPLCYQEIEKYKLGNPKSFHYLNQSNCFDLAGINEAHDYLATRRAMDIVGISKNEQVYILRTVLNSFPQLLHGFVRKCHSNSISLSPSRKQFSE